MFNKKILKNNTSNETANTSLMLAIERNNYEIAKLLIKIGADIDAINNKGQTALSIALKNRNFKIIELLVNVGADITIGNNDFSCS